MTVQRRVGGKRTHDTNGAPQVQADYVANYNAIDRNDRDSADYLITIRTLRIICWALDRVIHAAYVVVCFLIKSDIGQKQWKQYLDHHSGRHNFQIDLALSVITMESVFSGMVNQMKDQTLCNKTISSHAIATNVFFV